MIHFAIKNLEFAHTYIENGKDYQCSTHCHNSYELYFLLSGNVDYVVGTKQYSLKPFDLLVIPPSIYHCPRSIQGSYERVIFNFSIADIPKDVRPLLKNLGDRYYVRNNVFFRSIPLDFLSFIESLPSELLIRTTKNLIELSIINLSQQATSDIIVTHDSSLLSKIITYIDDNINKNLTLNNVAKIFYTTPAWINYSFKKRFNIPYSQYVKTKKMIYAQSLLQNGEPPVNVSLTCGFEFYTTFLRQYKSIFGRNPSDDFIEKE